MFGGIGGALKSLSGKAEEMIEKTKTSVGEMAAEKKAAATAMLEAQAKKTTDALWQSKTNVESELAEGAAEAKAAAIDGFDAELANAEKLVNEGANENRTPKPASTDSGFDPAKLLASTALAGGVQNMEKEVEKVVDEKLKEVSQSVDTKMKEADQFIDHKRDEVVKVVQDETQKAANSAGEGLGSVLGKAKGLLPF